MKPKSDEHAGAVPQVPAVRRARRPWRDLSGRRRALLIAAGAVQAGLAGAAWTDLARRPASQVRGPKWRWALAIAVNFVGPIAYFRLGRRPR